MYLSGGAVVTIGQMRFAAKSNLAITALHDGGIKRLRMVML